MRPAETFDIAVIGSGFGGSLLAMIARRLGKSVVLLERGSHPRFAIGESSTPLANLLLEELATEFDLPRLLPLTKWGSWQRRHPDLPVGLKRGFSFFPHTLGQRRDWNDLADSLFVAASPHDDIADTHWYRPAFDEFLVREAKALGVDYRDCAHIESVQNDVTGTFLAGTRDGRPFALSAAFVIDASGPHGLLHRTLGLGQRPLEGLPPTQALFTHFTGVRPIHDNACHDHTIREDDTRDNARCNDARPADDIPFPIDAAAVHHVFPGGWIWVLRFNNGITSAGVAATDDVADRLRFHEKDAAWARLLRELPAVGDCFAGAAPVQPFVHLPRLSFASDRAAGGNWALLPSAAGFVDPLLSTGFPLTLLGVLRLGQALRHPVGSRISQDALHDYERQTLEELDAAALIVASLYATMNDFPLFARLTLLYFAAASYAETVRRLGKPERAAGYLLHRDPVFGPRLRDLCRRVLTAPRQHCLLTPSDRAAVMADVLTTIAPIDIAGWCDVTRANRYPVRAEDLLHSAAKVDATEQEIKALLRRCGFEAAPRTRFD